MNAPCPPTQEDVWRLLSGTHDDPHAVLGAHRTEDGVVVRALRPDADTVDVLLADGSRTSLTRIHPDGLFSGVLPSLVLPYRLVIGRQGEESVVVDGYQCAPTLDVNELHAIAAGEHRRLWTVLGARRTSVEVGRESIEGVVFRVWAPHATAVRVRGDFNGWNGRGHPLRALADTGVWEVFVPHVEDGARYRYEILGPDGRWRDKVDPMASATTLPPAVTSVVFGSRYRWGDAHWMAARATKDWRRAPMSVYEVHLGSWRPGRGYRALAHELAAYVSDTGFTHVQLLTIAEHPFGGSWGYQVSSYFAPTARFGDPDDFRYLVDRLHQVGIGVFCDFVPAHFPRDAWSLGRFDGTPLYEYPDPRLGEHPDWGTYVFDYRRPQVRDFLVSAALFWLEEFHLDGLRVDAVSSMLYRDYSRAEGEWLPNEYGGRENLEAMRFIRELTTAVHDRVPGALVIAEESTSWPGVTADLPDRTREVLAEPDTVTGEVDHRLGFDLKWNLGWMHDTLDYLVVDPVYRSGHHDRLVLPLTYAWDERFLLPLSHDEVVHGKGSLWSRMPGEPWAKAAGVRALLAWMWAHPGKQLLFMGGEFGQPAEWDADGAPAWHLVQPLDGPADDRPDRALHRGILDLVRRLNLLYRELPALHCADFDPRAFAWVVRDDRDANIVAFLRHGDEEARPGSTLLCVANFAGIAHTGYRVGVPFADPWRVVLDTAEFGLAAPESSAVSNGPVMDRLAIPEQVPAHGRKVSIAVDIPPLSVLWLIPEKTDSSH